MVVQQIGKILLPTRPQPDTVVAIYLLKAYGEDKFPGITNALIETKPTLNIGESFESLLEDGVLAIDIGGGPLDHHGKQECTSELVASYLDILKDPSISQMLAYAKRDDKDGKGTISRDPLDRAFGLSGLISALNKQHTNNPDMVVSSALPLLAAHHTAARQHHVELPLEVANKKKTGAYEERTLTQGDKNILMVCVVSDKPSMPTYLRSQQGPRADVVVQRMEGTNHFCILSRQDRKLDLSKVAALIRMREAELAELAVREDATYLEQTGRIEEIPFWYFDPMTNSILNGGAHNLTVAQSAISWDELKQIVHIGLQIGGKK